MLLFRGEPFAGESLSSYRQRIWMRNGYRLFPVFSPELRRTDPDLQSRDQILDAVARQVDRNYDEIAALSLRAHPLLSAEGSAGGLNMPRWVVLLQYARSTAGAGSMFCPACLLNGEEPYFRTGWRLSVSLACPIHQLKMLDRCPACSFPAWPYAAASFSNLFGRQLDLDQCPRCLFRLRESTAISEDDSELLTCAEAVATGKPPLAFGPLCEIPVHELFGGLRAIMNIALKTRSRRKVGGAEEFEDVVAALNQEKIFRTSFDRLNASHRRKLASSAWSLMSDWPSRFIEFAHRCGVSAVDFSEEREAAPRWFMDVVDRHLGQPGRLVTFDSVEVAIQRLSLLGHSVNAEAVGRMVGSKEAKAVRLRLGKRKTASVDEMVELIAGLQRYMRGSTSRRETALFVRARNVAAVAIAILGQMTLEEAMAIKRSDLPQVLESGRCRPILRRNLIPILEMALDCMAPLWTSRDVGIDESFFVPHRGSSRNSRGPREALGRAMESLDGRLRREALVFFDPK